MQLCARRWMLAGAVKCFMWSVGLKECSAFNRRHNVFVSTAGGHGWPTVDVVEGPANQKFPTSHPLLACQHSPDKHERQIQLFPYHFNKHRPGSSGYNLQLGLQKAVSYIQNVN